MEHKSKVTTHELRDYLSAIRVREANLNRNNIIQEAFKYRDMLLAHPLVTKSAIAKECEISRIRVYQILNLLKLAPIIREFLQANDSPEVKGFFTERRLRPLAGIKDTKTQINEFRNLVRDGIEDKKLPLDSMETDLNIF